MPRKSMTVELRSGDEWEQLIVNGKVYYENHSIPGYIYLELLEKAGATVTQPEGDFDDDAEWVPGER